MRVFMCGKIVMKLFHSSLFNTTDFHYAFSNTMRVMLFLHGVYLKTAGDAFGSSKVNSVFLELRL